MWGRAFALLLLLLALASSIAPAAASQDDGCFAFSEIYAPIDEPAQFWRARGGIRREDIDACRADLRYRSCPTCAHRLMVLDNRLYMHLDSLGGNMHARYETALFMMINALRDAAEPLPDALFEFSAQDHPPRRCAVLAFLSPADLAVTPGWDTPAFLFPDWSLMAWPELRDYPPWQRLAWQVDALERAMPWAAKDGRLLWRGTTRTNARRGDLIEAAKAQLLPERVDVVGLPVGWYYLKNLTRPLHVPPAEWCRYRYLAHTEGRTWSVRLNHMALCRSVIVAHDLQWRSLVPALMTAGVDYLTAGPHFERLGDVMAMLWGGGADAAAAEAGAAARAVRLRRLLTPAGLSCYVRELLRRYAAEQAFNVSVVVPRAELAADWVDAEVWLYRQVKTAMFEAGRKLPRARAGVPAAAVVLSPSPPPPGAAAGVEGGDDGGDGRRRARRRWWQRRRRRRLE